MIRIDFLRRLRAANRARAKEWTTASGDELALSFLSNELAGELGEFCNVIKKIERETLGMVGSRANPEDAPEEAGDILICLDRICDRLGINLADATMRKFNKTSLANGFDIFIEDQS